MFPSNILNKKILVNWNATIEANLFESSSRGKIRLDEGGVIIEGLLKKSSLKKTNDATHGDFLEMEQLNRRIYPPLGASQRKHQNERGPNRPKCHQCQIVLLQGEQVAIEN